MCGKLFRHIFSMLRISNLLLAAIILFPSETRAEDPNCAAGPLLDFRHHLRSQDSDNHSVKTTDSNNSVLKKRQVWWHLCFRKIRSCNCVSFIHLSWATSSLSSLSFLSLLLQSWQTTLCGFWQSQRRTLLRIVCFSPGPHTTGLPPWGFLGDNKVGDFTGSCMALTKAHLVHSGPYHSVGMISLFFLLKGWSQDGTYAFRGWCSRIK